VTYPDEAIMALHNKWANAELNGDMEGLAAVLAEKFEAITPSGLGLTKREWCDRHANGYLKNHEFFQKDVSLRLFGDTAILIGVQLQRTTYQGEARSGGPFRFTQIISLVDNQWLGTGLHISAMPVPTESTK
jgi:ketosteroid isomerase-like protein